MLPLSRNKTYTTATPVRSADLNDIQDCVVAGAHGTKTRWFPPYGRIPNDVNITTTNGFVFANANVAAVNYIGVPIDQGARIVGLRARVKGTGAAGNVLVKLVKWRGDVTETVVGTITIVSPPATWADYSGAIGPVNVTAGDYCFFLRCELALQNQALVAIGIDYEMPL
jgi:hypothetical protein